MKKISVFIIKKVKQQDKDIIELFTEIDAEARHFVIKIDKSGGGILAEFTRELEFLLRANDVLLSKNLMKFLKRVMRDEQINLPFNLFSESLVSRKTRPRQPQIA